VARFTNSADLVVVDFLKFSTVHTNFDINPPKFGIKIGFSGG
jgi:hypothetical protein